MTTKKFVDYDGLAYFAGKVRTEIGGVNTSLGNYQTNTGQAISEVKDIAEAARDAKFATINGKPFKGVDTNYSLTDLGLDDEVAIIVTTRPELAEAKYNKIYLVPDSAGAEDNVYTEWIKVNDGKVDKWEELGQWKGGITVATEVAKGNNNPVSSDAVASIIESTKTDLTIPIASSSKAGVIKPGTTSGRTYGVAVNPSTGEATVSVPWTDRLLYQASAPTKAVSLIGSQATAAGQATEGYFLSDLTYNSANGTLTLAGGAAKGGVIDAHSFTGTAERALNDGEGAAINQTYVKNEAFDTKFTDAADRLLTTLGTSDIDTLWDAAATK